MKWYYFIDKNDNVIERHRCKDDAAALTKALEIAIRIDDVVAACALIGVKPKKGKSK